MINYVKNYTIDLHQFKYHHPPPPEKIDLFTKALFLIDRKVNIATSTSYYCVIDLKNLYKMV